MTSYINVSNIALFGTADQNTIDQITGVQQNAIRTALMADNHAGYVMPIGGVAAYDNKVSVVGVGFDIACLDQHTPILTYLGYTKPIRTISQADMIISEHNGIITRVKDHSGAVNTGERNDIFTIKLWNGRRITCTSDHQIRTSRGWVCAKDLIDTDLIYTIPYQGFCYDPVEYDWSFLPIYTENQFGIFLRLFGMCMADGHLSKNGKRISWYVYDEADKDAILQDLKYLNWKHSLYVRTRGNKTEYHIAIHNRALTLMFSELGIPLGKKTYQWDSTKLEWMVNLPQWCISNILGGFCSGDCTTPTLDKNGKARQHCIMQNNIDVIDVLSVLLSKLDIFCYACKTRNKISLIIDKDSNSKFLESVYFYYAKERRMGSAKVYSFYTNRNKMQDNRLNAYLEAKQIVKNVKVELQNLVKKYNVPHSLVSHAKYSDRGIPRVHDDVPSDTDGEYALLPIKYIQSRSEYRTVYDISTVDEQHNFIANGIVVHNCGVCAMELDLTLDDIVPFSVHDVERNPSRITNNAELTRIADMLAKSISFGIGRTNLADDAPTDHNIFIHEAWYAIPNIGKYRDDLRDKARRQLGTVGSGNHYVDLFVDINTNRIWVGVHFGSRGLGHTIASNFLAIGQGGRWGDRGKEIETLLDLSTTAGSEYWELMHLAGQYAYIGREWVANKVASLLGAAVINIVHNHHNFAWKEHHRNPITHELQEMIVVRKGATPAFPNQYGCVGGSMGDNAVIVKGTSTEDLTIRALQEAALYSTVHGAGRVMSRTEAKGKRDRKSGQLKKNAAGEIINPGKITRDMMDLWLSTKGVILRGGDLDESPHAYRRLDTVIAEQGTTIEVVNTLRPVIVLMAGSDTIDPYKD